MIKQGNDFSVLAQIYEDTVINEDVAYFSKLAKETGLSARELSKNLDQLSDLEIIYLKYQKIKDGKTLCCFYIDNDAMHLAEDQYNKLIADEAVNSPR